MSTIRTTPINKVKWDWIDEKQEKVRWWLALGFAIWFAILIVIVLCYIIWWSSLDTWRIQLINMLFNVISWLVGTILGFYFWQNWR